MFQLFGPEIWKLSLLTEFKVKGSLGKPSISNFASNHNYKYHGNIHRLCISRRSQDFARPQCRMTVIVAIEVG
jgi:hypothetical protein